MKKKLSFKVSSPWQPWLEHSLFPCLNVCPVNLTVAAEAVWRGCLINGSTLVGDSVGCLRGEQPDTPHSSSGDSAAAADGIDFELGHK